MADLIERLSGNVGDNPGPTDTKLPVHQFFASLVALANGQLTRSQIETAFNIPTSGVQATDLDTIITLYTGIVGSTTAAELRRVKYRESLHAIFMLSEHPNFSGTFSKAEIGAWLTAVAAGTV